MVVVDPVTAIGAGEGSGQAEPIAGLELMDGGAEERAADLVKLVEDHRAVGAVELSRIAAPADRMQEPDGEHLAIELAAVLLHHPDLVFRHPQLGGDLLRPLVHQAFEMEKDQRAPTDTGGSVKAAHGLAGPGRGTRHNRLVGL